MSRSKPFSPRLLLILLLALVLSNGLVASVYGAILTSVRVGPHKNFDRMVFEFDQETASFVSAKGSQKIEILFKNVQTAGSFVLPSLPPGLVAVKSIDAFRVGNNDVAFEITLAREAATSELPLNGKPYRLALDLSPKITQSQSDKPEYIPGDQPIPTKFAETKTEPVPAPNTELSAPPATNAIDPAKAQAVLAYFYLAGGDTPKAQEFAGAYTKLTGEKLEIPAVLSTDKSVQNLAVGPLQLTGWWMLAASALAGLIGGMAGSLLLSGMRNLSWKRKPKAIHARDLSDAIEADLAELEQTVGAEAAEVGSTQPAPAKAKPRVAATAAVAETAAAPPEAEAKESLMDRRVRRVLDLSKQGKTPADIASELEMGQDEVKLILDLNS